MYSRTWSVCERVWMNDSCDLSVFLLRRLIFVTLQIEILSMSKYPDWPSLEWKCSRDTMLVRLRSTYRIFISVNMILKIKWGTINHFVFAVILNEGSFIWHRNVTVNTPNIDLFEFPRYWLLRWFVLRDSTSILCPIFIIWETRNQDDTIRKELCILSRDIYMISSL